LKVAETFLAIGLWVHMGLCHIGVMGNSLQLQRNRAALRRAQRQAARISVTAVEKATPAAPMAVKRSPKLMAPLEATDRPSPKEKR